VRCVRLSGQVRRLDRLFGVYGAARYLRLYSSYAAVGPSGRGGVGGAKKEPRFRGGS